MRGPVHLAQEDMRRAVVLILTKDNEGLPGQRMERISDGDFRNRNQGIMSPPPIVVVNGLRRCIR
jgi:hypothetical protein